MICLQRLNPIPLPVFFVLKNGIKIFSITSGDIPIPLSPTRITARLLLPV
jgi:hypothetical protein